MVDRNTGRSRGFGFVTFESEDTIHAIMKVEHQIMGKYVEIKKAEPRDTRFYILVISHPFIFYRDALNPSFNNPYPSGGGYDAGYNSRGGGRGGNRGGYQQRGAPDDYSNGGGGYQGYIAGGAANMRGGYGGYAMPAGYGGARGILFCCKDNNNHYYDCIQEVMVIRR